MTCLSHQYHTYIIFFKVQCDCTNSIFKFNKFTITNIAQSIYAGNTITNLQYCTDLFKIISSIKVAQLLAQYRTNFFWFYLYHNLYLRGEAEAISSFVLFKFFMAQRYCYY